MLVSPKYVIGRESFLQCNGILHFSSSLAFIRQTIPGMEHLAAICFACRIGWNDSHAACYFNLFFRILPEALFNENLSFVQTHARPQLCCHSPYEQCWLRSSVLETAYAMFEETATGWRKDASEFWKHLLPAFLSRLDLFHYGMAPLHSSSSLEPSLSSYYRLLYGPVASRVTFQDNMNFPLYLPDVCDTAQFSPVLHCLLLWRCTLSIPVGPIWHDAQHMVQSLSSR